MRLSELGSGVILYGLEYPGLSGGLSWCYLTIAKGVIIATQPETDCGTSLTNIWCQEFFEVLNDLEPVRAAGEGTTLRWFEHYDRGRSHARRGYPYGRWSRDMEVSR